MSVVFNYVICKVKFYIFKFLAKLVQPKNPNIAEILIEKMQSNNSSVNTRKIRENVENLSNKRRNIDAFHREG